MRIGGPPEIKRIKWSQPVSTWKRAQAWRAKRAAMREKFEAANSSLTNAFVGAQSAQSAGMAELAIKASMKRIQQKALDAAERLDNIQVDKTV
jgi:hypothetical protein